MITQTKKDRGLTNDMAVQMAILVIVATVLIADV